MILSPEEQHRIYEEERVRKEAQDQIQREEDQAKKAVARRNAKRLGVGLVVLFAVAWVVSMLTGSNDENRPGWCEACSPAQKQEFRQMERRQLPTVRANTLKEGRAACASREILEALAEAIRLNDQRAARTLMQRGCIRTTHGMSVSVLDATWTGIVKIRATIGTEAAELWTLSESLQD